MNFSSENFINPSSSTDKNIHVRDINGIVKYIISPFNVIDIRISNNLINISLKSNKFISLDFSTSNESKLAIVILQNQLDILTNKTPFFIDKLVKNYIDSVGITGPTGSISTPLSQDVTWEETYGPILKDSDGISWRLIVGTSGNLSTQLVP